jgi:hypothetical protein
MLEDFRGSNPEGDREQFSHFYQGHLFLAEPAIARRCIFCLLFTHYAQNLRTWRTRFIVAPYVQRSRGGDLGPKVKEEVMMRKGLLTIGASILLVAVGSVASNASQMNSGVAHQKRITRHQNVPRPDNRITNFSSSSVLHVGVNHPPKNR